MFKYSVLIKGVGERMSVFADNERQALEMLQPSFPILTLTLGMIEVWNGFDWEYAA